MALIPDDCHEQQVRWPRSLQQACSQAIEMESCPVRADPVAVTYSVPFIGDPFEFGKQGSQGCSAALHQDSLQYSSIIIGEKGGSKTSLSARTSAGTVAAYCCKSGQGKLRKRLRWVLDTSAVE